MGGVVVLLLSLVPVVNAAAPLLGGVVATTLYVGGPEHGEAVDVETLTSPLDALTREPVRRGFTQGVVVGGGAGFAGAVLGLVVGAVVFPAPGVPASPLLGAGTPAEYLAAAALAVVEAAVGGVLAGATSALFW